MAVFANAARGASDSDGASVVVAAASAAAEELHGREADAVFVSELDGVRLSSHDVEVQGWRCYRAWPGEARARVLLHGL